MGRNKNELVWQHFNTLENGVQCNYCSKTYAIGNVNKMERHFLVCLQCSDEVKKSPQTTDEIPKASNIESEHERSLECDTTNSSQSSANFASSTP